MASSSVIPLVFFPAIGCIGFSSNVLLLTAVWKCTPQSLSTYSILIANTAIVDVIASIACIITVPRQITTLSGFLLIFHGPGSYMGEPFCWISFSKNIGLMLIYSITICMSAHLFPADVSLFVVHVICFPTLRFGQRPIDQGVALTLILVNGVNFLIIISLYFEFTHTRASSVQWFNDSRIPKDVRNRTIGIVDISARWSTQTMLVHISSTSPIVFTCCFLMQRRIFLFLNENKFGLSASSLIIHRMVLKALRSQLLISFIASMGASLLLLSIFEILRAPILDYLQPAITCSVLSVSALVNLIFVKPYKEFVLNSLGFHHKKGISPIAPAWYLS